MLDCDYQNWLIPSHATHSIIHRAQPPKRSKLPGSITPTHHLDPFLLLVKSILSPPSPITNLHPQNDNCTHNHIRIRPTRTTCCHILFLDDSSQIPLRDPLSKISLEDQLLTFLIVNPSECAQSCCYQRRTPVFDAARREKPSLQHQTPISNTGVALWRNYREKRVPVHFL